MVLSFGGFGVTVIRNYFHHATLHGTVRVEMYGEKVSSGECPSPQMCSVYCFTALHENTQLIFWLGMSIPEMDSPKHQVYLVKQKNTTAHDDDDDDESRLFNHRTCYSLDCLANKFWISLFAGGKLFRK